MIVRDASRQCYSVTISRRLGIPHNVLRLGDAVVIDTQCVYPAKIQLSAGQARSQSYPELVAALVILVNACARLAS
jgi:hypothetical protein